MILASTGFATPFTWGYIYLRTVLLCLFSAKSYASFAKIIDDPQKETPWDARPNFGWPQISRPPRKGKRACPQYLSSKNSPKTCVNRVTTTTKLGLRNVALGSVISSFLSSATANVVALHCGLPFCHLSCLAWQHMSATNVKVFLWYIRTKFLHER